MPSTTGAGQQDPSASASDYNQLLFVIQQELAKLSTVKVVQIKAVDTAAKTVDVQPMVSELDGDSNSTPHGVVLGVNYLVFQYGKSAMLADPVVGDIGIMMCADRDISAVKTAKKVAPPGSFRQFDVADGIYIGGILNDAPEQWIRFNPDGGINLTDKFGNAIDSSDAGIAINGVVFSRTGEVTGDLHVAGTITADTDVVYGTGGARVTLKAHQHPGNNQPPTPGH